MAGKSAAIKVNIIGDSSGFSKSLGEASTGLEAFSGKMQNVGKSMMKTGGMMTAGITMPLVAIAVTSVKAFQEAENAQAQLDASLKSTNATVWTSGDHMDRLAQSMQDKLGIDGDLIKSGESLLLTFTNVQNRVGEGNDIFDKTTKTAADMSVKLGMDLPAANLLLGKALNDPVKGMGALKKAGVQLSEEQQKQVKQFMAVNDIAGAQNVILGELDTQFGGSAEAAGNTSAGGMEKLRLKFEDIQESIGERLLPILEKLSGWLQTAMDWWDKLGDRGQTVALIMAGVAAAIGPVVTIIGALVTVIGFLLTPVGLVVLVVGALVAAFLYFYNSSEGFKTAVDGVVSAVRDKLGVAFTFFKDNILPGLQTALEYIGGKLQTVFTQFIDVVVPALEDAFAWIQENVFPRIQTAWDALWPVLVTIKDLFKAVFDSVVIAVTWAIDHMDEAFRAIAAVVNWLWPIIEIAWTLITTSITAALNFIQGIIKTVTAVIKGDWSGAWDGIKQALKAVWDGMVAIVSATFNLMKTIIMGVVHAIGTVMDAAWEGIKTAVSSAFNWVKTTISNALEGAKTTVSNILSGIGDMFGGVKTTVTNALSGLAGAVSAPFKAAGQAIKDIWNNTIGGKGISIPDIPGLPGRGSKFTIPRLHSGGVFDASSGVEGLALLKNGETVRTRQQEMALGSSFGGGSGQPVVVNINFHGPVARDSERWIAEQIETAVARGVQFPKLKQAVNS